MYNMAVTKEMMFRTPYDTFEKQLYQKASKGRRMSPLRYDRTDGN